MPLVILPRAPPRGRSPGAPAAAPGRGPGPAASDRVRLRVDEGGCRRGRDAGHLLRERDLRLGGGLQDHGGVGPVGAAPGVPEEGAAVGRELGEGIPGWRCGVVCSARAVGAWLVARLAVRLQEGRRFCRPALSRSSMSQKNMTVDGSWANVHFQPKSATSNVSASSKPPDDPKLQPGTLSHFAGPTKNVTPPNSASSKVA